MLLQQLKVGITKIKSGAIITSRCPLRTIMTSSVQREEALKQLHRNSYYAKYAEKIAKVQQTSPAEFLSRIDVLPSLMPPNPKNNTPTMHSQSTNTTPPRSSGRFTQFLQRGNDPLRPEPMGTVPPIGQQVDDSLDTVMKVDLVAEKTPEEITAIWREYHRDKDFLAAVIPSSDYTVLCRHSELYPMFLLALPRSEGYEFIVVQFAGNRAHFTPLLYYQVHQENAPECLTITHYTDFEANKGVVLMRGEFDATVLGQREAQCLANQLQLYYVRPDQKRLALLECFNRRPDDFQHIDLVNEIESLSL